MSLRIEIERLEFVGHRPQNDGIHYNGRYQERPEPGLRRHVIAYQQLKLRKVDGCSAMIFESSRLVARRRLLPGCTSATHIVFITWSPNSKTLKGN